VRVTHVITRLVIGGAQENTIATVRACAKIRRRSEPDFRPDIWPGRFRLSLTSKKVQVCLPVVPELVRPVHPLKDFIALRKLEKFCADKNRTSFTHIAAKPEFWDGWLPNARAFQIIIHHIQRPSFGIFKAHWPILFSPNAEHYAARVTTHFVCLRKPWRGFISPPESEILQCSRAFSSGFKLEPFLNATNDFALRKQLGLEENHFVIGKCAPVQAKRSC